jgi:hypothetical protein
MWRRCLLYPAGNSPNRFLENKPAFVVLCLFINMDYRKHYELLCERGKVKREGYLEKHHIIPRCKGGDDSKENLTWLTAKEHYIAHYLMHMMDRTDKGLWFALFNMAFLINEHQQRYQVGSRTYQRLKQERGYWARDNREQALKYLEKAVQATKGKKRAEEWNRKATQAWIAVKGKGSAMKKEELEAVIERHKGVVAHAAKELGWSSPTVVVGCKYHGIDYKKYKQ